MERGRDSDREMEREKRRGWIEGETVTERWKERKEGVFHEQMHCG